MTDTMASLHRKISSAGQLQSVVRTMKALAASSISQYEQAVCASADYYRTVELGLGACFRENRQATVMPVSKNHLISAVVFGSDQGLVGQFNESVADYAKRFLADMPGKPQLWIVGERLQGHFEDSGLRQMGVFGVPNSVKAITVLVARILAECERQANLAGDGEFYLFYNHPKSAAVYSARSQRLLPMDERWRRQLTELSWPTANLPELMGGSATLRTLISEYLFLSLFRAGAESLASENASRLAAMERADKNIGELLESLKSSFHRLRQSGIDEELFDVISGYEALSK